MSNDSQRPPRHSVWALPRTNAREDEQNVWTPAELWSRRRKIQHSNQMCFFFHFIFSKCNMTNLSRHSLRLIPWHCLSREQVCWIFIEFRKHTPSYVEITCLLSNKPKKFPDVTWNKNRRVRNFILIEKKWKIDKDYDLSELMIWFNIISLYMLQVRYEFPPICKHWTAPEWLGLGPFSSALPQPQKGEAPRKCLNSKTCQTKRALLFLDHLEFYGPCTHIMRYIAHSLRKYTYFHLPV